MSRIHRTTFFIVGTFAAAAVIFAGAKASLVVLDKKRAEKREQAVQECVQRSLPAAPVHPGRTPFSEYGKGKGFFDFKLENLVGKKIEHVLLRQDLEARCTKDPYYGRLEL